MYVQVKDLSGNSFVFSTLLPEDSLIDLKHLVADEFGVAPARQRLVFKGKQLNDDNASLADCKIDDQSQIHLVVRHKRKYRPDEDDDDDQTSQLKEEIKHLEKKLSDIISQTRDKQDTCLHEKLSFKHDTGYQCGNCKLILTNEFDDYHHKESLHHDCKNQLNQFEADMLTKEQAFLETKKRFTDMLSKVQRSCLHADYNYQFGILDSAGNLNQRFEDMSQAKKYLKDGGLTDLILLEQWVCKDCRFLIGQRELHKCHIIYQNRMKL